MTTSGAALSNSTAPPESGWRKNVATMSWKSRTWRVRNRELFPDRWTRAAETAIGGDDGRLRGRRIENADVRMKVGRRNAMQGCDGGKGHVEAVSRHHRFANVRVVARHGQPHQRPELPNKPRSRPRRRTRDFHSQFLRLFASKEKSLSAREFTSIESGDFDPGTTEDSAKSDRLPRAGARRLRKCEREVRPEKTRPPSARPTGAIEQRNLKAGSSSGASPSRRAPGSRRSTASRALP